MRKYVAWVLEENGFWTDLGASFTRAGADDIISQTRKAVVNETFPVWFKVTWTEPLGIEQYMLERFHEKTVA